MRNGIEVFRNEKFGAIRTVEINDEIWFVGKDVATALGYQNTKKAIADHVDDDDKQKGDGVTIRDSIDRIQHPVIINESGLYSLILSSKLESAKEFKHWVTSEVLPSIRNTGSYTAQSMSKEEIEAKDKELRIGMYDRLHALANKYEPKNESYSQILDAYATKELTDEFLLPLPETEKTYSAGEIGQMLGISANKVGKIANANGLKTEKFGKYFIDKSKYANREVETFRYNADGMTEIKRLLRETV